MQSSRYARLNPFANSNLAGSPVAESPLQFSSALPDRISDATPQSLYASNGNETATPKKSRFSVHHQRVSTSDGLAYMGLDPNNANAPQPKRRRTNSSLYRAASSIRDFAVSHFTVPSVAAPWEHELSEKHGATLSPSDSIRFFDYRRQRKRLFINSTFQWFVTAFICAALASCLYGFSTVVTGLTGRMKYIFNALVTGLSICLGLNLASSLRGYAQLMRWRFLASGYRTLQDFELVMNCDSQSKVFRLLWAGRTRGQMLPNKTQLLAFLWIFINIALQVFTALLGLTYSVDTSTEYISLNYGNVSISDFSYIGSADSTAIYYGDYGSQEAWLAELAVSNAMGITGQDYSVWPTTFDNYFANEQAVYTTENYDFFWYRWIDRSPLAFETTSATLRTVNCTAKCQKHKVTYGGYAGFQSDDDSEMWYVTWVDSDGNNNTWWVPEQATGATTWMSNLTSNCGPRCTQVYALQVADNSTYDVPEPVMWSCTSNVSTVDGTEYYIDPDQYKIADREAKAFAGSIGWSGVTVRDDAGELVFNSPESELEMISYNVDSQWSPAGGQTPEYMAYLLMKFTAGSISALDAVGPRLNVTGYGPGPAQIINVQWRFAASILGGIPFAQVCILFIVILFANKAIIKDTSHLSTARLLRPIVEKLGDRGCLLTGDEIAEQLGNYRVIYGVRDPATGLNDGSTLGVGGGVGFGHVGGEDGKIRHLDIIDETEGLGYRRGRMPQGRYDGLFPSSEEEKQGLLDGMNESGEDEGVRQRQNVGHKRRRRGSI